MAAVCARILAFFIQVLSDAACPEATLLLRELLYKDGEGTSGAGITQSFLFLASSSSFPPFYSYIFFFFALLNEHFFISIYYLPVHSLLYISFTSLFIHDNAQVQRKFGNNRAYVLRV